MRYVTCRFVSICQLVPAVIVDVHTQPPAVNHVTKFAAVPLRALAGSRGSVIVVLAESLYFLACLLRTEITDTVLAD